MRRGAEHPAATTRTHHRKASSAETPSEKPASAAAPAAPTAPTPSGSKRHASMPTIAPRPKPRLSSRDLSPRPWRHTSGHPHPNSKNRQTKPPLCCAHRPARHEPSRHARASPARAKPFRKPAGRYRPRQADRQADSEWHGQPSPRWCGSRCRSCRAHSNVAESHSV